MPVLLGAIVGRAFGLVLGRVVFSHAVLTVAVWYGLAAASFWLVRLNVGTAAAPWATVLGPAALLAWTLRSPATNRAKLWLLDGFYVWSRLGIVWGLGAALLRLLADGGVVMVWVPHALPFAGVTMGSWLAQRALKDWLRRSHVRAGDGSLLQE